MSNRIIIFICLLAQTLCSCGGSESTQEVDLSKITLVSPEYIRTKIGQTVNFELNTESLSNTSSNLSYEWRHAGRVFSTEKNPSLTLEDAGLFDVRVTISSASSSSSSQTRTLTTQVFAAKESNYKTVAYFPSWRQYTGNDWDKLTHICLCFGEVKADGTINIDDVKRNLTQTITKAHQNGVYVLLSLGGGTETEGFTAAILNETARKKITESSVKIINELKLDGIDVDYEKWDYHESADNNKKSIEVEKLYKELREGMPEGQILSIAISPSYIRYKAIREPMIQYLDLVNLMIYDATGPWAGSEVGPHSSWEFFLSTIELAKGINVPDSKIVAGVPFYGYRFRSPVTATEAISYGEIVRLYPGAEDRNEITSAQIYYDGKGMITQKSQYVKDNNLAGIMIWEITQDSKDASKSLLVAIDNVLETSKN